MKKEEKFQITPWGCMVSVLNDYGIDTSHLTGKMGEHLVEDFMDAMVMAGYIKKKEETE